jgi:antibiotic biosynthesis monooxygenase (ABM) superfamily enzyme
MTDIEHPIVAALHGIANTTQPYPCDLLTARRAEFLRQINQHNVNARLDAIAAAFVWATAEEREALIEEAAELLTLDPDECNIPTPPVSEQDDERNSRPFPY